MSNKNKNQESGDSAPRNEAFAVKANLEQKVELLSSLALVQLLVIDGLADPQKEGLFDKERDGLYNFLDLCRTAVLNEELEIKY